MADDVLTKEEREDIEARRYMVDGVEVDSVVRMADRLVSEVERLRARNEALEKVAKAVLSKPRTICDRCDDGWNDPLNLALSTLNAGSGGET